MKKFILFAAAAAMFAACANENDLALTQQQAANETDANLISFDAYTMRSTNTRAGVPGTVTLGDGTDETGLKGIGATAKLAKAGFGVFAYYTDNFDYTPLYVPNFMYNEQVTWQTDQFKYALPKYWPNEHGSQAISTDQDRISFFAYAPYVEVDPSTGMLAEAGTPLDASDEELQWGITGMKRNTLQGDPIIQYISSFDQSKCVDLCWGTTGDIDVTWGTNGSSQTIQGGYPWLNVRKPNGVVSNESKVKFNFQHALARLAVNVKTDFSGNWNETDVTKTKVWVRSIRFTGIAHKAALNLNNPKTANKNKARWMDYYGTNELELGESVTVYDGRKDGSEGVAEAIAPNEAILGLNPQIIQDENQIKWDGDHNVYVWGNDVAEKVRPGVTTAEVSVFCNGDDPADFVYVIPTGEKVNVEIVYDIETIDKKLPTMLSDGETYGSTVENCISKTITFGTGTTKFESGKSYILNLILGMKDVQFTADVVDDWGADIVGNAWLPNNLFSVAAGATTTITVPYNATSIEDFVVNGLTSGQTPTVTPTSPVTAASADPTEVPTTGEIKITGITMTGENSSVSTAAAGSIVVVQATPSLTTTINVKRGGKPFVFKAISALTAGDDKQFDIEADDATSGTVITAEWAAAKITVEKQAVGSTTWTALSLNESAADALATTYKRNNDTAKITISDLDGLVNGDKIRVTIQVGDVAAVSYIVNVTA